MDKLKKDTLNKFASILLFSILAALVILFMQYQKANSQVNLNVDKEKSLWVWNTPNEVYNEEFRSDLFIRAEQDNFNVLKIAIDDVISFYNVKTNSFNQVSYNDYKAKLNSIVAEASSKGIKIDLIAGNKEWVYGNKHYIPLAIVDFVAKYNSESSDSQKVRYIEFDIEPQTIANYETNKANLLTYYVTLADKLVTRVSLNEPNVRLAFTLPHYFDSVVNWTPKIRYNNKSQYTFTHLIDLMNKLKGDNAVSIMAYRNFAEGKNGSIDISKSEINEIKAKGYKTKVAIISETGNVDPSWVTFYDMCKSDMYSETKKIDNYFASSTPYAGLSYHYLDAFKDMCE